MRFLYRRGKGARRRVMHLCGYDPRTGEPSMVPLCGIPHAFNTTCNFPLGQRTCKRCLEMIHRRRERDLSPVRTSVPFDEPWGAEQ